MSNFSDVGDFHERFDLPRSDRPGAKPTMTDDATLDFRVKFMQEELDEFVQCRGEEDLAGMFDALLDLTYVAMGTAHLMGLPWQRGWDEVQRANMTKVRAQADGSDSKRGSSLDVVKPEGWRPPDIQGVLDDPGECPVCNRPYDVSQCRPAGTKKALAYCQSNGYYKEVS